MRSHEQMQPSQEEDTPPGKPAVKKDKKVPPNFDPPDLSVYGADQQASETNFYNRQREDERRDRTDRIKEAQDRERRESEQMARTRELIARASQVKPPVRVHGDAGELRAALTSDGKREAQSLETSLAAKEQELDGLKKEMKQMGWWRRVKNTENPKKLQLLNQDITHLEAAIRKRTGG